MRAISTVLDVTLCLLLVGAAVATLTVPAPPPPSSTADETAELLATTTANVTGLTTHGGHPRVVTGTRAELLARAALANLTLEDRPLAPATRRFRRAVRERVARTLAWSRHRVAVTARWVPYPNAPLGGALTVGPRPPPSTDVGTARLTVPVDRVPTINDTSSYRGIARGLADAVLSATLAPPSAPRRPRATGRRGAVARALGRQAGRADRAALRRALADRLAADLRARFSSPTAAAAALRPGEVTIVVREWAP